MIPVTKPFLPPIQDYNNYVQGIWERNWLTNNGPLVLSLEAELKKHLDLENLLFVTNGTIAIQLAIKALGLKGNIITTPFSYVATTSSIVWEGCKPIFVDIDPDTFNINPSLIEKAIDSDTTAILATHCFGNACDIEAIDLIAKRNNLKVIYDAAHCFGSTYNGKSIFGFGDISTASFHSTKLFHSIEGGGVITSDPNLLKRMAYMRNFGHDGVEKFNGVGINGKNSEFHAAMGLCNLKYIERIRDKRKEQSLYYDELLTDFDAKRIVIQSKCGFNYAYYPIVFSSEEKLLKAKSALERQDISPRRYFFPSLSHLDYVQNQLTPVSDSVAKRILCLPLYHTLSRENQQLIARVLMSNQNNV